MKRGWPLSLWWAATKTGKSNQRRSIPPSNAWKKRDGWSGLPIWEKAKNHPAACTRSHQPGEVALQEWLSSGVVPEHQRDEFFIKLMIGLVSGRAEPERLIQAQRVLLFQEMHAATNQRDDYDPLTEMAQILLLDKAIMHLEADLRWLDMIELRLATIKEQPIPEPEILRRGRPRKGEKGSTYPPPEKATSRR